MTPTRPPDTTATSGSLQESCVFPSVPLSPAEARKLWAFIHCDGCPGLDVGGVAGLRGQAGGKVVEALCGAVLIDWGSDAGAVVPDERPADSRVVLTLDEPS